MVTILSDPAKRVLQGALGALKGAQPRVVRNDLVRELLDLVVEGRRCTNTRTILCGAMAWLPEIVQGAFRACHAEPESRGKRPCSAASTCSAKTGTRVPMHSTSVDFWSNVPFTAIL